MVEYVRVAAAIEILLLVVDAIALDRVPFLPLGGAHIQQMAIVFCSAIAFAELRTSIGKTDASKK